MTGPVYNAVLREVTFHDDHSVKTKTTRQYLDVYVIEFETISGPSRKAQETFRRKRKVNSRSSQVEAFINRKVSNQCLVFLNTKIFILDRKK